MMDWKKSRSVAIAVMICITLAPLAGNAKGKKPLSVSYSTGIYVAGKANPLSNLSVVINDNSITKADTSARLFFYANNDARAIPMQLVYNKGAIPVNTAKKGKNNILFTVAADDIFYTVPAESAYTWKWQGRARAPLSPVATVAQKQVKQVNCWAILKYKGKTYYSDTATIQIK